MPVVPVVMSPTASVADTSRDYTVYSAFLGEMGLLIYEGEGAENYVRTLEIEIPQTDTRNNPNELPDALGRHYAVGDFSHGSGQRVLHKASSDPARFNYSEGFDNSEVGILRHLHDTTENVLSPVFSGATGKTCKAGGYTFVTNGTTLLRFDDITGTPTSINPHAGDSASTVYDICSDGSTVYVTVADGIHQSTDNGANWTHQWDITTPILIAYVKERIVATTARVLYELTGSGAVTGMDRTTLRTGWTFTSIAETGEHVYASAVYESTDQGGQSRVFHYGLDSNLDFIEQGSSVLPDDDLCYSLKGYLGMVLIGCGRINEDGGKDALVYKAIPEDGYLPIDLVADSEGAGTADLSVKTITTSGRRFLIGWSLGDDSPYGARSGTAVYDPAFADGSFTHHLKCSDDPTQLLSIEKVAGRLLLVCEDGIFYEADTYVAQAFLIASTGNWNNPALKNWDQSSISTNALPATASVELQYSLTDPENNDWALAGEHATTSQTEATFSHPNLESADFTVKIVSNSTSSQAAAPEIKTFSVRSNPTVDDAPYLIVATFRIFDKDRLGKNGRVIRQNPVEIKEAIEALHLDWADYYTQDVEDGYHVRIRNFNVFQPIQPIYHSTLGEELSNGYLMTVEMRGTKN